MLSFCLPCRGFTASTDISVIIAGQREGLTVLKFTHLQRFSRFVEGLDAHIWWGEGHPLLRKCNIIKHAISHYFGPLFPYK